jgi:putative peptidoglycan lipid II flippase
LGLIAVAIVTVIYPKLSMFVSTEKHTEFKSLIVKGMNVITVIFVPITVATIILSNLIIRVAYERGVFNEESTLMTSSALVFYMLGATAWGYRSILDRAFFSLKNTKTPMINAVLMLSISITLNLILIRYMGHNGLALSTSVSALVTMPFLVLSLRKRIGSIGGKQLVSVFIKSVIAASVMGVVVWFGYVFLQSTIADGSRIMDILTFALLAGGGALIYFALLIAMRVGEVKWFISALLKREVL